MTSTSSAWAQTNEAVRDLHRTLVNEVVSTPRLPKDDIEVRDGGEPGPMGDFRWADLAQPGGFRRGYRGGEPDLFDERIVPPIFAAAPPPNITSSGAGSRQAVAEEDSRSRRARSAETSSGAGDFSWRTRAEQFLADRARPGQVTFAATTSSSAARNRTRSPRTGEHDRGGIGVSHDPHPSAPFLDDLQPKNPLPPASSLTLLDDFLPAEPQEPPRNSLVARLIDFNRRLQAEDDEDDDELISTLTSAPASWGPQLLRFDDFRSDLFDATIGKVRARHGHVVPRGDLSVRATVMSLLKLFFCSGILFMPRAYSNGGVLFSVLCISTLVMMTTLCILQLIELRVKLAPELEERGWLAHANYGDVAGVTIGANGKRIVDLSLFLSQASYGMTYPVVIAQCFARGVFGLQDETTSTFQHTVDRLIFLEILVMAPLVCVRRLSKLALAVFFGDVVIFSILIYCFSRSAVTLVDEGVAPDVIGTVNTQSWGLMLGTSIFAFEGIGCVMPVYTSMREPEKFTKVFVRCISFIGGCFGGFGLIIYLAYGSDVPTNAMLTLSTGVTATAVTTTSGSPPATGAVPGSPPGVATAATTTTGAAASPMSLLSLTTVFTTMLGLPPAFSDFNFINFLYTIYGLGVVCTYPLLMFPMTKVAESYIWDPPDPRLSGPQSFAELQTPLLGEGEEVGKTPLVSSTNGQHHDTHLLPTPINNIRNPAGVAPPGNYKGRYKMQKNVFRSALVVLFAIIAREGSTNLDAFVAVMGALFCIPMGLVYAPWMVLSLGAEECHRRGVKYCNRTMLTAQLVFGLACMSYSTWTSSVQLIKGRS